jgi:hypothetical protein
MEATKPPGQFHGLFPRPWKHGLARKSKPWTMEGKGFCRCLLAEQGERSALVRGRPAPLGDNPSGSGGGNSSRVGPAAMGRDMLVERDWRHGTGRAHVTGRGHGTGHFHWDWTESRRRQVQCQECGRLLPSPDGTLFGGGFKHGAFSWDGTSSRDRFAEQRVAGEPGVKLLQPRGL